MTNKYKNPIPTVDIIIELKIPPLPPFKNLSPQVVSGEVGEGGLGIVLIQRKNPPYGWAIPGGFVDYGESLEHAAIREAEEETSLKIKLIHQFHTYSDPKRDKRFHTISTVFIAKPVPASRKQGANGKPKAKDDAKAIGIFTEGNLPKPIAFDHKKILEDYFKWKREGRKI